VLRNYAISAFSMGISVWLIRFIPFSPYTSIWLWVVYGALSMALFLIIDLTATLLIAKGAKDSFCRIKDIR
jgi:hypothetical protein